MPARSDRSWLRPAKHLSLAASGGITGNPDFEATPRVQSADVVCVNPVPAK